MRVFLDMCCLSATTTRSEGKGIPPIELDPPCLPLLRPLMPQWEPGFVLSRDLHEQRARNLLRVLLPHSNAYDPVFALQARSSRLPPRLPPRLSLPALASHRPHGLSADTCLSHLKGHSVVTGSAGCPGPFGSRDMAC